MNLNADGAMSLSTSSPRLHPIAVGTWSVSDNEFTSTGPVTFGTVVVFKAPYSTTRLNGTWDAGRADGTFDVTKQ